MWGNNFLVKFNPKACDNCNKCKLDGICPTNAFIINNGKVRAINRSRCFNCGNCVRICPDAFNLDLKTVKFGEKDIPIVLRQSDRYGAINLAEELKSKILKGEFLLAKPTGNLDFAENVK